MSTKRHTLGTHRLVEPAHTLDRIRPHLTTVGVTRCANVTGLDTAGIPVYRAIRPSGLTVQATDGIGLTAVDAKVSAQMQAIERYHAEHPGPGTLRRSGERALRRDAAEVLDPSLLPGFRAEAFYSPDYEIDWVRGDDLISGEPLWLPASAVHLCWPSLYPFSGNGLASGNDVPEATLHALYELLERDAIARLRAPDEPAIAENVVDLASVHDPLLTGPLAALDRAGLRLVLFTVPSHAGVSTCWAVILDPRRRTGRPTMSFGFGTHLSGSVAAIRAVIEAAAARFTCAGRLDQDRLRDHLDRPRPTRRWSDLPDRSTRSLLADLDLVLDGVQRDGFRRIARVNLTRLPSRVPVVKVFVPGLTAAPF